MANRGNDMTHQDIMEKVATCVAEIAGDLKWNGSPDASLGDDLGCDSLDKVELAMSVEETFGIDLPDEAFEDWITVGDVVTTVVTAVGVTA